MDLKFTLRDIIAYFLCGLAFVMFSIPVGLELFPDIVKSMKEVSVINPLLVTIKESNVLVTLILIAGLYMIGHIIQAIDITRHTFAKRLLTNKALESKFWLFIYRVAMEDRVTGNLFNSHRRAPKEPNYEDKRAGFWKKVAYLQVKGQYTHSDYWYVLKDLINGLETSAIILFIWVSCFYIINIQIGGHFHWGKLWICLGYLVLAVFFWFKGRSLSLSFIESVESTNDVLNDLEKISVSIPNPIPETK